MSEHLFDLADFEAPTADVRVDPQRHHIALVVDNRAEGAFVDLGSELHWWAHMSLHLDSAGARTLGEALIAWADRHA
jgi:hypothetical protein